MDIGTAVMFGAILVFFGFTFLTKDQPWKPYLLAACALAFVVFAFTDPAYRYANLFFALLAAYKARESWGHRPEQPAGRE